jgi:aconitate hydratase
MTDPKAGAIDSSRTRRTLQVNNQHYTYYSLAAAVEAGLGSLDHLPYTIRVVAENLLRQNATGKANGDDLAAFAAWLKRPDEDCEIGFRPARMMMPESSGIPFLGDITAMRDAMARLGGDPARINPQLPIDLIVDHSVAVEAHGRADALVFNMNSEMEQNRERYEFLRWASQTFQNLRVFPPGSGILHQVNLEYLARVVWSSDEGGEQVAYPDSLIAMDSHTAMINGMGVIGWGVGGLEGGAVALGEPISMLLPEVIGCRLAGKLRPGVTSTDLVLTITQTMREHDVIAKFIEYFGAGVDSLTLPERATISNMTPECGATMCYFPVDQETLRYLALTGRDAAQIALVESYCKIQGLWRDASTPVPRYGKIIDIDLDAIVPCVAGPGRPDARVPLAGAPAAYAAVWPKPAAAIDIPDTSYQLGQGNIVLTAITSCTNTSNPLVMVGAGLLARNARRRGLKPKPWVKTSLSPGSRVVADYLTASGLQEDLDALGFQVTGFGCMSCMGNSGPLLAPVAQAIEDHDLALVAISSGNRNFDARVHPSVKTNFLASPPLVVAFSLLGTINEDIASASLGNDPQGQPVYLRDIWPDTEEVRAIIASTLTPAMYRDRYAKVLEGGPEWRALEAPRSTLYQWDPQSNFIVRPPFFDGMQAHTTPPRNIRGARVLVMLGDMVTTDHISPFSTIPAQGPAGKYLISLGVKPRDFVGYAARRLNHHVMVRGTFANVRLRNELTPGVEGTSTLHLPDGEATTIYEAAERYRAEGVPLVVVAGREYGAGSSRDWAAKGTGLLGIRAVIAESFERIHRANLVSMGVLPLQLPAGVTRKSLALSGRETFDIEDLDGTIVPKQSVRCTITREEGSKTSIDLVLRLDTRPEVDYTLNDGIAQYVLRRKLAAPQSQDRSKP